MLEFKIGSLKKILSVVYCTYPTERLYVLDEVPDLGAGCARLRGRRF